ncbi:exonuclease domain-containing protein [Zunongwangia sp.]|uniref:exonuclease domain-containing protein n=1 Tax=Zunongwangia sp. TaxID=1965325 RepID=UPI003AA96917
MYAILDIETTGGKYNEEGITEIAIYKFDGDEVVDQFISLVNPERPIQPFVVGLTGINNEMLRNAPKFYEVAKRIIEVTEDCILVAHNAKFDYRILKTEFRRLGYDYQRKSVCTVELSKKLIPDMPSYSLGKLVHSLGIPLTNRHRADGDAKATVKLFKILLAKDSKKAILKDNVRLEPKRQLDSKLVHILDDLPSIVGVYYLHDKDGEIIYVGKSKNIKKRINQHFTNDNAKARDMQKHVAAVSYEATGNELVALLKENQEIKKLKPKYNKALRKNIFTHGIFHFVDDNGYINFKIRKATVTKNCITTFSSLQSAKHTLANWIEEYQLCSRIAGLHPGKGNCFNYTIKSCYGACTGEESAKDYNKRAQQLIEKYSYTNENMLIIDRGRKVDEKSVVLVESGSFKGFGFFDLNFQIQNPEIVKNRITSMRNNRDAKHIIQSYLRKNKKIKTINY